MNRKSPRWLPATLLVLLLSVAVARQATAQATPAYKIGDKIECNVTGKWQPGTIMQVSSVTSGIFYVVNNDGEAHTWDRWASEAQVRRRTGVLSPTAQARHELDSLGEMTPPARGSLDETFINLIRQRYAQQGSKAFPVTVTFQSLLIGKTHRYGGPDVHGESADGPGGNTSTTVYPVRAQYYYRTAFRDAFLSSQQENEFSCFKNQFSAWQCNLGSGRGEIKGFREERASP